MGQYFKIQKEKEKYNYSDSDSFRIMVEKDGFLYVEVNEAKPKKSWVEITKEEFEKIFPKDPEKPDSSQVQAQTLLELQKINNKSDMINKALSTVLLGMQKGGK